MLAQTAPEVRGATWPNSPAHRGKVCGAFAPIGVRCRALARKRGIHTFLKGIRPTGIALCVLLSAIAGAASAGDLAASTGESTIPFALESIAGTRLRLADHSDRVVLIHFFATWCEPCRAEVSALQRLTVRYAQQPVTVLAIDVGEVGSRVRHFFDALPVSFPILLDEDRAVAKSWQVSTLPTTFVLNWALEPRFIVEGDFDWDGPEVDAKLNALLANGPPGRPAD